MAGSTVSGATGSYGTKGVAAPSNVPGARWLFEAWLAPGGELLLFGGRSNTNGRFNDIWQFDGSDWTWINGDNLPDQLAIYGLKGVPSATNKPGGRGMCGSARGPTGAFFAFGGWGLDATGQQELNDLWTFDGATWTWVGGSSTGSSPGVYGTKGVPAAANFPGGRENMVAAMDAAGNFWLFGGYGYSASGAAGRLNDLWKFDGTNWTWISGSNGIDSAGVYGTQGIAAASNMPGSRLGASGWIDSSGNFWLFGGYGHDSVNAVNGMDDIWKFDGTNWTWVSGSNTILAAPVYGTQGVSAPGNTPGGRETMATAVDGSGNFWVFGGSGAGFYNDLWKWDGSRWTWIAGSASISQTGIYGTYRVPSASNGPGGREGARMWIDSSGAIWIMGGSGLDAGPPGLGLLNDLWRYAP